MKPINILVAERLLAIKAIKIQPVSPFRWVNGWKSPIYCDDRKLLSYPKERDFIKLELARVVAEQFPEADVVAGVAINAIAFGILTAHQLSLPFVYIHPHPKDHGLENQIEGDIRPGQKVIIIENQVAIGDNARKVIDVLRDNGCIVLGVITLLDYELPMGEEVFRETEVPLVSLTKYSDVVTVVKDKHLIETVTLKKLEDWHINPTHWVK